jgi:hypothetical protein
MIQDEFQLSDKLADFVVNQSMGFLCEMLAV